MNRFVCILLLLLPLLSLADEFDDAEEAAVTKAKEFVKQYPIVENQLDEIGLVNLWQRIQGLHNLISIWDSNREAFEREGPGELSLWQIRQRIKSHKLYASYNGNDEMVKVLADVISLHAYIADRYMNNEMTYSPYADVAGFTILSGRYFARNVWVRYGKCLRNKNQGKKNPEKGNQEKKDEADKAEDKILM
ncbi:MAG: hypothetical protein LJE83_05870 [Gammaproteobacteria bacterium]|nr:hypothetical protein [Gammaproteobacteria bacterium]